tara:strand:- start:190 stop:375 length:186 start_codon:yes stop_codon:yes gene_type:complete
MLNTDQVGGLVRAVLTAIGGIFVSHGYVTSGKWEAIAGFIAVVGGAAWSWWTNRPGIVIAK